MTAELDPLQAVATMRDCVGELLVASPLTLRELAAHMMGHQGCTMRLHTLCLAKEPCDRCHVQLTLARLLHIVAQASEQGYAHKLPGKRL
jgi:hypothetical protein